MVEQASDAGVPANSPEGVPERRFWSSVTWPRQEAVSIFVAVPLVLFAFGLLHSGPLYGALVAAGSLPIFAGLWTLHCVLRAWATCSSQRSWVRAIKAAVRYLITDR
jgi:hypothetical protein